MTQKQKENYNHYLNWAFDQAKQKGTPIREAIEAYMLSNPELKFNLTEWNNMTQDELDVLNDSEVITRVAMEKEAIPGQVIDTPFSSKFGEAQLKEDMKSNAIVDVLGEVEDDEGEKIITKIVSKTNKKGLEKLSDIEEDSKEEEGEDDDKSKTKSISS